MRPTIAKLTLPGLLAVAAAWLAFRHSAIGDFRGDAAPALAALADGKISAYLGAHPIMGPFATLFEAPFYMVGRGELGHYRWVCFGCLLMVGAFAWFLAEAARRRGAGLLARWLVAFLVLVNPVSIEAIQSGHPEELLTAVFAVGAVAFAIERRETYAAVSLGLAIATKQWAVLAIFPVLMALPARRLHTSLIAAVVVLTLYAPTLIAAPGAFVEVQGHAASGGHVATIWTLWFPFSPATPHALPSLGTTAMIHDQPAVVRHVSHLLVVALIVGIPSALWARRRSFLLAGNEPLALLALLALVRCVFDPLDNLYYHAPFLLALLAWDAYDPQRLPLRGLTATAFAYLFWRWSQNLGSLDSFNLAYLAVVAGGAVLISSRLFDRRPARATGASPVPTTETA